MKASCSFQRSDAPVNTVHGCRAATYWSHHQANDSECTLTPGLKANDIPDGMGNAAVVLTGVVVWTVRTPDLIDHSIAIRPCGES